MKNIWYIFKKYYGLYFVICVCLGLLYVFTSESSVDYKNALIFPLLFFVLMSIFGTFDYWKHEIFRPNKIKKELNSYQFSIFRRRGFKKVKNELRGQIENYCVSVGIEWKSYQKKPNYYFGVLYHPMSLGRYLKFKEYIRFNDIENNGFFVRLNLVEKNHNSKEFSKYKFNDSLKEISRIINYLKSKNLKPISFKEWEKSYSEVNYIEDSYLGEI